MLERESFSHRLDAAIDDLFEWTGKYCFNELSPNVRFVQFRPFSQWSREHDGMDDLDREVLRKRLARGEEFLTKQDLVDLLFKDGRVPGYINMTVLRSLPEMTIIELEISRRLKYDEALYHSIDKHPPFHLLVSIPIDRSETSRNGIKWDVNAHWLERNKRTESRSFWKRLRSALTN